MVEAVLLVAAGAAGWQFINFVLSKAGRHSPPEGAQEEQQLQARRTAPNANSPSRVQACERRPLLQGHHNSPALATPPKSVRFEALVDPEPPHLPAVSARAAAIPAAQHPAKQRQQQGESEAAQQRVQQLEAQLSAARHDRKKVNVEMMRAREVVTATEQRLTLALEQIGALQSRTVALLTDKSAAERNCRDMKMQLGTVQSASAKARKLQQMVESLQAQLDEAGAARAAAEAQLRSMRKQALVQQHRQQQGGAAVHRVQAEADAAKEEAKELRRVCHGLQEELEQQRTACASSEAQLAAAQSRLRQVEGKARKYREGYTGLEAKLNCIATGMR